jgi:hypothetical protein
MTLANYQATGFAILDGLRWDAFFSGGFFIQDDTLGHPNLICAESLQQHSQAR